MLSYIRMQSKTYSSVGCSQTIFENHLAEVQQEKKKKVAQDGRESGTDQES